MLNKYDFTNKDDVIDQPSILKITSDLVLIIHAGGTSPDTMGIPEEGLVILIGNIDSFIPPTQDPIIPDDPEPTPTPIPKDGITMTAMIANNAGGKLNIRQLQLLLWDEDNQQIQSVTGTVTTNNRIEQGSSAQCTVIFEKEYEGLHFASGEQYSETYYLCNCGYKINGSNYTFTTQGASENYIFRDGGSFTVTIPNNTTEWMGGGQIPTYDTDPDPQPGDTVTQIILFHNYTNNAINIDCINVLVWDENNSSAHTVTGNIIGDLTVEANNEKTLTMQFKGSEGESITDYIGWKFAQPGQYPETFSSNCGYHVTESFIFKAGDISQNSTFGEGYLSSFAPANQTEWITNVDPQPEPSDSVSQGTVNLIIKNDSNITFDENHQISTTQDGQTVTATTKLNAYFKLYVQGALNKISIIMSARNNSSQTDLNLDSNNNPACRFLDSGYTLSPNGQIQISNVHWKVNSDDTRDNIPEIGRDIINGTGEGSNTFYMSNGYYSTKDFGIKVVVSGESGKFKNNGTYTLSIQNV